MNKKFLMASIALNIIAGAFVLMSFGLKTKNVNDSGGNYLMISQCGSLVDPVLSITDGDKIADDIPLRGTGSVEHMKENCKILVKKLNELKSQGYTLVTANGNNYMMEKK